MCDFFVQQALAAIAVFAATFLILTWYLQLQALAAAFAAGLSAIGTLLASILTLLEATLRVDKLHIDIDRLKTMSGFELDKLKLEIEKLRTETQRLARRESDETRRIQSPTIEEMDRVGLNPISFVSRTREEHLPGR